MPGTKIATYTRGGLAIKRIITIATIIQVIVKIIIGVGTPTSGNQPGARASIGDDIIFYIYITCCTGEPKRTIARGTMRAKSDHGIIIDIYIGYVIHVYPNMIRINHIISDQTAFGAIVAVTTFD